MLKNVEAADLVAAVRKAARGQAILSPHVATRVMQELHGAQLDKANPFTLLSEREMEVLQLVANGRANAEIAEELHITIKTVRAHVSNILSKLHLKDRTQAAVYAWSEGIVRRIEDK